MIIRRLEAIFGLQVNGAQFKQATDHLDRFAQNANTVMGAVAGHFVFQALQNFVTNTANAMAEVGKTAGYLELKTTDAGGRMREPLELLDEVADRLNKLPTQSERIWVVDSMFGDQGAEMLKMLKDGSLGLSRMRGEARSLGIVLDSDAIAKASRFSQALKRMKSAFSGIINTLVQGLMPALTWMMNVSAGLSAAINEVSGRASLLRVIFIGLGMVLAGLAVKSIIAFGPMLLSVLAIGAGIAALALIADDLWVAFKGGNSVFASLHQSVRAFFEPIEQWVMALPKKLFDMLASLAQKVPILLSNIVPDFLKKGISATFNVVSASGDPGAFQSRMAPSLSNVSHQNRMVSHQNVSVAVNVKSGADPQAIGGEVSKAVRQELERERLNAFMGVAQYAS